MKRREKLGLSELTTYVNICENEATTHAAFRAGYPNKLSSITQKWTPFEKNLIT